jgi:hypothetical protein
MTMTETAKASDRLTEADFVRELRFSLERANCIVRAEVPSHGRARTDLILWDGECLIGIEAKLKDWGKAIGQAVLNKQCVDQSYLAMWSSAISDAVLSEAARFGVGVMALSELGMRIVLQADHERPIPELRDRLIHGLGAVAE